MDPDWRTFLGLAVPEALHAPLQEARSDLEAAGERVRWSRPGNYHLTLKFLGDHPPGLVELLEEALVALAARTAPFELEIRGLGSFPFRRSTRPRVLWAGLRELPPPLTALARGCDEVAAGAGVDPETRAYAPHVTLGRLRSPPRGAGLEELVAENAARPIGAFRVEAFHLYQVLRDDRGVTYEPFRTYPLGGTG